MNSGIEAASKARGITRLCHFTPSRNLQHIAAGKLGILATSALEGDERLVFNATDLARLDQCKTHICTSIEYPNGWYFERARAQDRLFMDWVVLLINPRYLWEETTLFCPRNAAAEYGRYIIQGIDGFESLFAERVTGTRNTVFRRSETHIPACPTDQQAEVLIFDRVHPDDIIAVAVRNEEQARLERVRLRTNGVDPDLFRFVVAEHMFQKHALSAAIREGRRPAEPMVVPPNAV
ncbi:DarT ssDNA thymidine ADP-ribosyltransferase family protein [Aurantimonas sp. VKM B-3413]|uniref:DarT ssDNA thymidine ADP-ribosyltransferase family protein n=1 Tax=Aurantimonas sp. VKM B-3413 TaxID=2779401 RepID=UPI001E3C452F|nr:DUF4433 domain-containing protein [Aurantimonas sp. VKM B-3413]